MSEHTLKNTTEHGINFSLPDKDLVFNLEAGKSTKLNAEQKLNIAPYLDECRLELDGVQYPISVDHDKDLEEANKKIEADRIAAENKRLADEKAAADKKAEDERKAKELADKQAKELAEKQAADKKAAEDKARQEAEDKKLADEKAKQQSDK